MISVTSGYAPTQFHLGGGVEQHTGPNSREAVDHLLHSGVPPQQVMTYRINLIRHLSNLDVKISYLPQKVFRENIDILNENSPDTLKYVLVNEQNGVGVYIRETPALTPYGLPKVDMFVAAPNTKQVPFNHIDSAVTQILIRSETGRWPPIFAVFPRAKGVSDQVLQKLENIPMSAIQKFAGDLVHDFSDAGFAPYHGNISEKVVASIITVKVAKGDTTMLEYCLDHVARPGDVVFLDGGEVDVHDRQARYANVDCLLREKAIGKGVKGFVVDGYIRDSAEYKATSTGQSFMCFAKGITPNGPTKKESGAVNGPLQYGEITLNSNDVVISEGHNIVVIPSANVQALIAEIGKTKADAAEKKWRGDALEDYFASHPTDAEPGGSPHSESSAQSVWLNLSGSPYSPKSVVNRLRSLSIPQKPTTIPIAKETLELLTAIPTSGFADAYSTLYPALTVGIPFLPVDGATQIKSAGTALTTQAGRRSIKSAILLATTEDSLVVHAENASDVVLDDNLISAAARKGIRSIVTNGTVSFSKRFEIPVYAKHYSEHLQDVVEGNSDLHKTVTMQGVKIKPGDIVVGDEDGVAIVAPGLEEHGIRGGHGIANQKQNILKAIRSGKAQTSVLAPDHAYLNFDSRFNTSFLRSHLNTRNSNLPLETARGSRGLRIPVPDQIRFVAEDEACVIEDKAELSTVGNLKTAQALPASSTLQGIPSKVIFNALDPTVVMMESTQYSGTFLGTTYISGIAGVNFSKMMMAKEQVKTIEVDSMGNVQTPRR